MCGVCYLVILVILLLVPSICITVLSPGRNSSVCPAVSTAATFSGVSSSSSWSDSVMYGRLPSSPEQSYILQMVKVATVPCVPGLGGPALPGRLPAMLMTGSCWPGAPTQGQRSGLQTRPAPACLARIHSVALSTARLDTSSHNPVLPSLQQG